MINPKLSVSQLHSFFERGKKLSFLRGEIIESPLQTKRNAFYIETGFVKVYTYSKYGDRFLLCILSEGDLLPIPGFFGLHFVECHYEAMDEVVARRLSTTTLRMAIERNPHLMKAAMLQLDERINLYNSRLATMGLRTQRERLISFIITSADRFGVKTGNDVILTIPLTHAEIADAIAGQRESVSRLLTKLQNEGLLKRHNHALVYSQDSPLRKEIGA